MNIDSIQNGVVLDHIQAGKSMDIYRYLHLDQLDCSVAIIKNVRSGRMGKKDIIKIDSPMEVDLDVLGYIDPNITVNIIRNGVRVEKKHLELPKKLVNVIRLLRDRKGQEVLSPRDGTARSDCVDIQFFPLRQGRIYGFCIAGKFSCNADFFLQFLLRFGGKWRILRPGFQKTEALL